MRDYKHTKTKQNRKTEGRKNRYKLKFDLKNSKRRECLRLENLP